MTYLMKTTPSLLAKVHTQVFSKPRKMRFTLVVLSLFLLLELLLASSRHVKYKKRWDRLHPKPSLHNERLKEEFEEANQQHHHHRRIAPAQNKTKTKKDIIQKNPSASQYPPVISLSVEDFFRKIPAAQFQPYYYAGDKDKPMSEAIALDVIKRVKKDLRDEMRANLDQEAQLIASYVIKELRKNDMPSPSSNTTVPSV